MVQSSVELKGVQELITNHREGQMPKHVELIRDDGYRAYRLPTQDSHDINIVKAHLMGFYDTAEANGKDMVVEIWYYPKTHEESQPPLPFE